MSEVDLKEMETPTLVFGEVESMVKEQAPLAEIPQTKTEGQELDDSVLTDEERQKIDAFAKQIDLHNTTAILQYGVGTQKKIADFSSNALGNVRAKDLGEVGDMLSDVVTQLKDFDEEEKGLFGILKKPAHKLQSMKAKYSKVETNINKICEALESNQVKLLKDIDILDKMYDLNLVYFKELSMYILAGKKKLQETRETELPELLEKAKASGLPEDAQAARDMETLCDRFEKKLYDLELTRVVSIQTAPQIRLVQNSDTMMVEKIQSTIVNTIPLWKSQMVLALGVTHAEQAARAQREVSDMTNELLKKNAEVLKVSAIESAKESERGIVDMETLKNTNANLIATLDEVMKIQADGREKRRVAEEEMRVMENDLKQKLLELSERK
ncbi:MAG: toxic anion resistance protein [Bacteroidales bacterium]|nr:toxic anion resistance protein [Bacteroidales bacterium]MCM1414778.1 toxic anion resistance protein [bacterium]MCM1423216.1 toxic anion resistance protein [bacterium]